MSEILLAGCVITNPDGEMLLLRRTSTQKWEMPGGKVEPNETAEGAAMRENLEELDIDVLIKEKIGEGRFTEKGVRYRYQWFGAIILRGEPRIMEPHKFDAVGYKPLGAVTSLRAPIELSSNMLVFRKQLNDGEITLQ